MKKITFSTPDELREKLRMKAEERLGNGDNQLVFPETKEEALRLIYELQIHLIELEVQNENLWQMKVESDVQLKRYAQLYNDLYDSAPVGYCTVSRDDGVITKANRTAAQLLGIECDELVGSRLGLLVAADSRAVVSALVRDVSAKKNCSASAIFLRSGQEPFWVHIEARMSDSARSCRLMFVDINAHKQAEEQLEKLSMVASKTTNAIIITDASRHITWVNDGFTMLTEYTFAEALGKKPGALLQGEETDWKTILAMREALGRAEGFEVELVNYTKSKKMYWVHSKTDPIYDDDGALKGFISIQTNITKRKDEERRLRYKAELLNNIGESAIATDVEGKITYWNTAAEALYGWTAEEATGGMITEVIVSNQHQEEAQRIFNGLAKGERWSGQFAVRHKDGTRFDVHVTDIPVFDDQGSLIGIFGISRAVTERDRAEEKLKTMEANLNAIFDSSVQLLYLINTDFTILAFNNAAAVGTRRAFGKEMVIGDDIRNFILPEHKEQFEKNFHRALQGETIQLERSADIPSAGMIRFEFRYVPVIDADGRVRGVSFTALDITKRLEFKQTALGQEKQASELSAPNAAVAEYITISTATQGNVVLNVRDDIAYLEGAKDYTRFFTHSGKDYLTFGALGKWEERLLKQGYIRVHRSTIVNLDAIRSWKHDEKVIILTMLNGAQVKVSRGYKAHFLFVVR